MKDIDVLRKNNVNLEKSLEIFGDMDTYNEMLQTFYGEVETKLADIISYKENADMANYAIKVHSLKSDAKYFGFEKLAELSYEHELQSKANNMYYIYDNFDSLVNEARKVINMISEYLGVEIIKEEITTISKDKKILIVDDSEVIRKFVNNIFTKTHEVIIATDGEQAISSLTQKVDLMFLDLNMPNVNGFNVLEFMKKNNIEIPVIIITGIGDESIIQQAESYKILGVLRKPFNEKEVKKLSELIEK